MHYERSNPGKKAGRIMRPILVTALFVSVGAVQAEPSPSVRYLMNQSVSLFEWGMFRLHSKVENLHWDGLDTQTPKQFAHVEYDWSKNLIRVELTIFPHFRNFENNTTRQVCGSLINQMKFSFGVAPGSEFLRGIGGIGTYFHPQYFENVNIPKTLDDDIEAITTLQVEVMASKTDQPPFQEMMSCSSDLRKPEVRYFVTDVK